MLEKSVGWVLRTDLDCEEVVHLLQLLLRQDEAVDLLLAAGARDGDTTHKHRTSFLLFLGLRKTFTSRHLNVQEGSRFQRASTVAVP